jgi:uncharacterized protein YjiS (DUF1127 family)
MLYRPAERPARTPLRVGALASLIAAAGRRLDRWQADWNAIRRLQRLDDHLLDDMGIDRIDITDRVKGRR